jgi:acetoacetyl-CoA reductase/3-oxoacyl-[acyl-carrier protein] reductase
MIIITGASKGIGKFLFDKFAQQGQEVIGTYNSTIIEGNKPNSMYKVDITDLVQVSEFFLMIKDRLQDIILINSAGANYTSFAHKANMEAWRKIIDINLFGTFHMIHHILQPMREQNYGRIINFSSVVAQMSVAGTSAYAASKSGLWGLTKSVAAETASKGITINTLNLGYFNVGMIKEVSPDFQEIIKSKIPVGQEFGDPENIFQAISFIINAPYLTGASIDINGGII